MFIISQPLGIFSLVDEESRFPKATDLTLIEKLSKNLKPPLFQRPKSQNLRFIIQHYAGPVRKLKHIHMTKMHVSCYAIVVIPLAQAIMI